MNAFVYGLVVALHILICLILVAVVLLQTGKGADIGAAFGGSSQTVFGSRGPTTFFHYLTTCSAILFIFTSLFLSCTPGPSGGGSSVIGDATPSPTAGAVSSSNGNMAPIPGMTPMSATTSK